jgi:hypothetical protein
VKQIITHPLLFLCFLCCSFTCDDQRTFVALQFAHPMTQKSLNLVKELEEYWKCLMMSMCLMMGGFTLLSTTKAPPKNI